MWTLINITHLRTLIEVSRETLCVCMTAKTNVCAKFVGKVFIATDVVIACTFIFYLQTQQADNAKFSRQRARIFIIRCFWTSVSIR